MQKVIAIIGPTASGKSALGISLAQKFGGEILCADSRQIYRGMGVIARTPDKKEMAGLPHHLFSIANPKRQYSAGTYVREAKKILTRLARRGAVPIVVGGTGFYADALLRGLTLPEVAPNKKLRATLTKKTAPQLLAQLRKLDPKSGKRVDPHNKVRLIRAIEIATALGSVPALQSMPEFETLWLGLAPAPTKHAAAVRKGIKERLKRGMLAEAKKLRSALGNKRFLALGFEFSLLADYLDKKISRAVLAQRLEQSELGYAKRQMRWFKRNSDIRWIGSKAEALRVAKAFLSR